MAKGGITVKLDIQNLEKLKREMPERVDQVIGKLAFDFEADAKMNMSKQTPSKPGTPPGVRTGFLKNSIGAKRDKRMRWIVWVMANYAVHLEYGAPKINMAARPFLRPAASRIAKRMPDYFRQVFK